MERVGLRESGKSPPTPTQSTGGGGRWRQLYPPSRLRSLCQAHTCQLDGQTWDFLRSRSCSRQPECRTGREDKGKVTANLPLSHLD